MSWHKQSEKEDKRTKQDDLLLTLIHKNCYIIIKHKLVPCQAKLKHNKKENKFSNSQLPFEV